MRLEDGIVYWDQSGRHKCDTQGTAKEGESTRTRGFSLIAEAQANLYTLNRILEDLCAGRNSVP
jgi:hypothetical protein